MNYARLYLSFTLILNILLFPEIRAMELEHDTDYVVIEIEALHKLKSKSLTKELPVEVLNKIIEFLPGDDEFIKTIAMRNFELTKRNYNKSVASFFDAFPRFIQPHEIPYLVKKHFSTTHGISHSLLQEKITQAFWHVYHCKQEYQTYIKHIKSYDHAQFKSHDAIVWKELTDLQKKTHLSGIEQEKLESLTQDKIKLLHKCLKLNAKAKVGITFRRIKLLPDMGNMDLCLYSFFYIACFGTILFNDLLKSDPKAEKELGFLMYPYAALAGLGFSFLSLLCCSPCFDCLRHSYEKAGENAMQLKQHLTSSISELNNALQAVKKEA